MLDLKICNRSRGIAAAAALAVVLSTAVALAAPVDLTFGDPVVTGTGVGTTALYSNIGTQDGIDIDMLATITGQNTADVHDIRRSSDDHMLDMQGADDRWVTFRYQFFESGTSNPLPIQQMVWAVDDLDGYSARTESMEVSGLTAYTVNDPTDVTVSESGGTYTFTGSGNHSPGDADSGVAMLFVNQEVIVITYQVLADGPSEAGFNHDGDGDFAFAAPEMTWFGPKLYYTFNLTNDEDVEVEFHNQLPEGMKWDTEYLPHTTGSLTLTNEMLEFTEEDRTVEIPAMVLAPGSTTAFTLRTHSADAIGLVVDEAMTKPTENSGFPQVELRASSSIVLDGPPDTSSPPIGVPPGPAGPLVTSFKTSFCRYAWFSLGGSISAGNPQKIMGDLGIGPGGSSLSITGDVMGPGAVIIQDPTASGPADEVEDLSAEAAAALSLAEDFAALTPTQTFGNPGSSWTVTGSAPDGVNVINVDVIDTDTLTINGEADDWFIFNVTSGFTINSSGTIGGSADPRKILFNILPGADPAKVKITGKGNALKGAILAPYHSMKIQGGGATDGQVISLGGTMSSDSVVNHRRSFGGGCE